jgi:hypothetical protein
VDERDRFVTYTHGLGGPCYGWKQRWDAPRAALRFALGYLIMPLWGGGDEKTAGTVRLHHRVMECIQAISFNP